MWKLDIAFSILGKYLKLSIYKCKKTLPVTKYIMVRGNILLNMFPSAMALGIKNTPCD